MKIVLDTNVLSVAIARRSRFYPIWQAIRDGKIELVVTTDILLEYEEIIGSDLSVEIADLVLNTLDTLPNIKFVHKYFFWRLIIADPDDDKFVDCAVADGADFIVSNDRHFQVLKTVVFPKVIVLTAEEFLEMVIRT